MSGISRTSLTGRHRLDHVLVEAGQKADPVTRSQIAIFEAALRRRNNGKTTSGTLLRDEIENLTMPEISDPGLFATARSIDVLGHLIDTLLPTLDLPHDVLAITTEILREEVQRRQQVQDRLTTEGGDS